MTAEEINALIDRWMDTRLEEFEDRRAICGPVSDEYRESQLDGLSIELEAAEEALVGCDYRKIEREADELLRAAGIAVLDHDEVEFGRLCRKLLQGKQDVIRIESERWDGIYRNNHTRAASRALAPEGSRSHTATPVSAAGKLFSEVTHLYFTENPRAVRTDSQGKAEFERFVTVSGGDKPINTITKTDCRMYK